MSEFERKQREAFENFKKRFNINRTIAPHFTLYPESMRVFYHGYLHCSIVLAEYGTTKYKGKKVFGPTVVMKDGQRYAITKTEYDIIRENSVLNNCKYGEILN